MSSSGSGRMITIMGDLLGARIGGHPRRVRDGVQDVREAKTVANEVEVVTQEEGRIGKIGEETALRGGPLNDVKVIDLDAKAIDRDATEDLMRVAMTNRGTTRGRPLGGWARFSGPHWPQERTGLIGVPDPLRSQDE